MTRLTGKCFPQLKCIWLPFLLFHLGYSDKIARTPWSAVLWRRPAGYSLSVTPLGLNNASEPPHEVDLKHLSLSFHVASLRYTCQWHSCHFSAPFMHSFCPWTDQIVAETRPTQPMCLKWLGHVCLLPWQDSPCPPCSSEEQHRLHMLCPVCFLCAHLDRTKSILKRNQLFISWVGLSLRNSCHTNLCRQLLLGQSCGQQRACGLNSFVVWLHLYSGKLVFTSHFCLVLQDGRPQVLWELGLHK